MEIHLKSPQELAAQAMDSHPYFVGHALGEAEASRLNKTGRELVQGLSDSLPYTQTDALLSANLDQRLEQAVSSGVWQATDGQGAEDRLVHAYDRSMSLRIPYETGPQDRVVNEIEAAVHAFSTVRKFGMLNDLRSSRRSQEENFTTPTKEIINGVDLAPSTEKQVIGKILEKVVDIKTITDSERRRLTEAFPTGNFLFHGAETNQMIKIMQSGSLANAKTLIDREAAAADAEGREKNTIRRNSGYEGVSWSLNEIDALPGDRYHMAGFVVAPEAVISSGDQLAVPSRPAPYEVIQISKEIDSAEFYEAKTQFELYRMFTAFGESNSVAGNLVMFISSKSLKPGESHPNGTPLLDQSRQDGLLAIKDKAEILRNYYSVDPSGVIRLTPDLAQQVDNEVPVGAVWMQAMIDTGRIEETPSFKGAKDVNDILDNITEESITELYKLMRQDWKASEIIIDAGEEATGSIEVPVEKMYLVAARKDANTWLKVIARMPHKPAGILLYDDKATRLENFAGKHRGDHGALSDELRIAIQPGEDTIDYGDVLGTQFDDSMRAGHVHQVIAEGKLDKRHSISLQGGKLKIN